MSGFIINEQRATVPIGRASQQSIGGFGVEEPGRQRSEPAKEGEPGQQQDEHQSCRKHDAIYVVQRRSSKAYVHTCRFYCMQWVERGSSA